VEGKNRDRLTEQAEIRRKLARWEQGGGLARLRTVKVRDWRREYEQLSATELETKRREIAAELENASGDEREQLQAQLYVIELTRLDKNLSGPNQELSELEADLSQLGEQRRQIEQKLASIERELEEWREQKREFLENKVRLD
jgi:chromosome segregation ATPase